MKKGQSLSQLLWENGYHMLKNEIGTSSYTKNKDQLKDLNIKLEIIKLHEENTGKMVYNTGLDNNFLNQKTGNKSKNVCVFIHVQLCVTP